MRQRLLILIVLSAVVAGLTSASPRRRMTPLNTSATTTQSVNETANDTSRINAKRRANSISYVNDKGLTIFVDTITGDEWTDSTLIGRVPKMEYPLFDAMSVGVNIWDPMMRAFGQKYGLADAWVELSLHNRYKPVLEVGLGMADKKPSGSDYRYKTPLSVFFRLGLNYNFLFNSNPDYSFFVGLRYGLSPFSFSLPDVTLDNPYWGTETTFSVPSQNVTVGWGEIIFGLRVKLWGPISAGWTVKYQSIMHQSKTAFGDPWYIPGFGSRNSPVSGSFSFVYTFGIRKLNKVTGDDVLNSVAPSAQIEESASGQEQEKE